METSARQHRRESDADFSTSVSKKLKSSSRTGQACDRCKVRKIRCDSLHGGCSPCQAAHVACKTTDRITGRATQRGHTDKLEEENKQLKWQIHELQQQLKNAGVQVNDNAYSISSHGYSNGHQVPAQSQTSWEGGADSTPDTVMPSPSAQPSTPFSTIIPTITNPPPISQHPGLKMLTGSKVSLFGMELDGSDFYDDLVDNETFKSTTGVMGLTTMYASGQWKLQARLPATHAEASRLSQFYFSAIGPFLPILDKRDMAAMIDNIWSGDVASNFEALSLPERIIVQMMFGTLKHQYGLRSNEPKMTEEGVEAFKSCMVHLRLLLLGKTLLHVQALGCLALFSRNYQNPEAAHFVAHSTLWVAIQNNMHRSVTTLPEDERAQLTQHEIQMRKRCFWSIYGLVVGFCGRLGRPLPLRMQDIDVEHADALHDYLPGEIDLPEFNKCSFRAALCTHRLVTVVAQLLTSVCSVQRGTSPFEADIAKLEEELSAWKLSLPAVLRDNSEHNPVALYLRLSELEVRFLTRHPVIRHMHTTHYTAANLRECIAVCDEVLACTRELADVRAIDVQWVAVVFLLSVVFTTLFMYEQLHSDLTSIDLQKLKNDMATWDHIFGVIGNLIGSGEKMQTAVRKIVSNALEAHDKRLHGKHATGGTPDPTTLVSQFNQQQQQQQQPNNAAVNQSGILALPEIKGAGSQPTASSYLPKNSTVTMGQTPTQYAPHSAPHYTYSTEATHNPAITYASGYGTTFTAAPKAGVDMSLPPSSLPHYPTVSNPTNYYPPIPTAQQMSQYAPGLDPWTKWNQAALATYATPAQPAPSPQVGQDYINSANSLMALRGAMPEGTDQTVNHAQDGDINQRVWPIHMYGEYGTGAAGPAG